MPIHKLDAQLALQLVEILRQRGLRHQKPLRRSRDVARLRDRQKIIPPARVHAAPPLSALCGYPVLIIIKKLSFVNRRLCFL